MKSKNIRIWSLLGVVVLTLYASSCLKDNYTDFSKVSPILEFPDAIPGGSTALATTDSVITIRVDITGANAPTQDITVQIGSGGTAGLTLYNSSTSHVPGTLLPAGAYTLPSTVTIKAGKDSLNNDNRTGKFTLLFHPKQIPSTPGVNYVLPVAITGGSSGIVSGNFGLILFNFYQNPWAGPYNSTGSRYNFAQASDYTGWDNTTNAPLASSNIASTSPWAFSTHIITVDATNSLVHEGNSDGGFGLMNILVNSDNTVTISSTCPDNNVSGDCAAPLTAVANLFPLPGQVSTYNPATKTFNLYYQYTNSSGTFRVLHDVLVHQ